MLTIEGKYRNMVPNCVEERLKIGGKADVLITQKISLKGLALL
jgi:hypothetical protein